MPNLRNRTARIAIPTFVFVAFGLSGSQAFAQQYPPQYPPQQYPQQQYPQAPPPYYGQPPSFPPEQLDSLVSRVALYSDPLLAQVLAASTFPDQIPAAASWAMAHSYLTGDALARAIMDDRLPWYSSVMALLPAPAVLDMMARDIGWTQQLGSAVLAQRREVMDAVQRMRQRALDYGYLRSTPEQRVIVLGPGNIQIVPAQPGYYCMPVYNPSVVFARPARGLAVAISFGPRFFIGAAFAPWGWGSPMIDWRARTVIIDHHPWERTWVNRGAYVHPYVAPPPRVAGPRVERHEDHVHTEHRGGDDRRVHDDHREHDR